MALRIGWRTHGGSYSNHDRWGRYGHCAKCGGELLRVILAPDRDIRAIPGWRWLTPLCGQCATPEDIAYASEQMDCPGCGLPMHISPHDAMMTKWPACSDRCYQRAWRAARRKTNRAMTCEICETAFQPKRAEARYCSNACRQRAYRQRQHTEAA